MTESSLVPNPTARKAARAGTFRAWTPRERALAPAGGGGLQGLIRQLDATIRRRAGIIEYSSSPACCLRVVVSYAEVDMKLSDGVDISRGDPILDMHFWNERLPQTSTSPGLAFGGRFGRQLVRSFIDLAAAIETDPRLRGAVAIRARLAFAGDRKREERQRFGHWFDFEGAQETGRPPLSRRAHDLAEDVWLVLLTWTYNPGSLRTRRAMRRREDLWISKAKLIERYGPDRTRRRAS